MGMVEDFNAYRGKMNEKIYGFRQPNYQTNF